MPRRWPSSAMDAILPPIVKRTAGLVGAFAAVALTFMAGLILYFAKDLLVPIALATLLTFMLAGLSTFLHRVGLPRRMADALALICAGLSIATLAYVLSAQLSSIAQDLPKYSDTIHGKIKGMESLFGGSGPFSRAFAVLTSSAADLQQAAGAAAGADPAKATIVVRSVDSGPIATYWAFASPVLSPLVSLGLIALMTIFMLTRREDLRNRAIKLFGADDIFRATAALDDIGSRLSQQLLAQLAINLAFGTVTAVGLFIIGVPGALLWGALAAFLRFIPFLGVFVALLGPLLVAVAFDPSWFSALTTLTMFGCVEILTGNVVEPILYGHRTGLSPLAIVLAAIFWGFLWGPIGLLLSTPLTIVLVVLGSHVSGLAFLETLLSDKPPLKPHEMLYQRMLAGDPSEAVAQAKELLRERALATYYDDIALEAVRRSHQDIVLKKLNETDLNRVTGALTRLVNEVAAAAPRPPLLRARRGRPETWAAIELMRGDRPLARSSVAAERLKDRWRAEYPVVVLFGDDPLDSVVGGMLAQVLTRRGLRARVAAMSDKATLAKKETPPALICLSFMAPLTIAHLRGAVMGARRCSPSTHIVVGVWCDTDEGLKADIVKKVRADACVTSMSEAVEAVDTFI